MPPELQRRLLNRALDITGTSDALASRLNVAPHALRLWLDGRAAPPERVLSAAVDLVLEDDIARATQDRRKQPRDGRHLVPWGWNSQGPSHA